MLPFLLDVATPKVQGGVRCCLWQFGPKIPCGVWHVAFSSAICQESAEFTCVIVGGGTGSATSLVIQSSDVGPAF